jgi:hypothetical protein
MAVNAGIVYENHVKNILSNTIVTQGLHRVQLLDDGGNGNFNSHDTDLKLSVAGLPIDIEIKGKGAQMGETSFRYHPDTGFEPAKDHLDQGFVELVRTNALIPIRSHIDELLKFFRSYDPEPFHESVKEIPFRVTRSAWISARKEGLLIPIAKIFPFSASLITDHYNNKCGGVFYIQIERKGLFYMGKNPLNLPIPPLEGNINVEVRLKRSGSVVAKSIGQKVASATLIVVGRLKNDAVSPISLDSPEKITQLFENI